MLTLRPLIQLIRPHHWIKNGFIFLPLFFAHQIENWKELLNCGIAFVGFSLVAGSIYVINDLKDAPQDRLHPKKCNRPIANRVVSCSQAIALAISFFVIGMAVLWPAENHWSLMGVVGFYFVMNIAYTLFLKRFAIVDVFIIAFGFVLRVMAGGIAGDVVLSRWILLMTFLLALFLGFAKRRDDVLIFEKEGTKARSNITRYNEQFIDAVLILTGSVTVVAYIMYCVSAEVTERLNSDYLYVTSVFVIAGIIRYLQKTMVDQESGNPTKLLLKDRFLQVVIIGWIAAFGAIIYWAKI